MHTNRDYFPRGVNMYVPGMEYASDVELGGPVCAEWTTAPATADADGILDGHSIATAGSTSTFNVLFAEQTEAIMGKYGRAVTVLASGAATSTVTVIGRDYLGQPMKETLTLNGTNAVNGLKAFRYIDSVEYGATGGTTIDLGWRDAFGLPYVSVGNATTFTDDVRDGTQATQVVGVLTSPATATTGDPRGLFIPASAALPNGSRKYKCVYERIRNRSPGLHGVQHYFA